MYNTVVPFHFNTCLAKKLISSNISQPCNYHPFNNFENLFFFQKHWTFKILVIQGMIKCIFFFLMFLNPHIKLQWKALFSKPMFGVNKQLFVPEKMHVTW